MKALSIFIFTLVIGINLFTNSDLVATKTTIDSPADTLNSVSAGDYNTASTWNKNRTPTATDYVICEHGVIFSGDCHMYDKKINLGVTVTYSANCHIYLRM